MTASSCPAGSRTATTSAAARSPASRPRWRPSVASPPAAGPCSGSATASRSSARPACSRACCARTRRSRSSAATCACASSVRTRRSRGAARGAGAVDPREARRGLLVRRRGALRRADGSDQIVLRYEDNPNGAVHDVAGVCNREGNVLGLMPHPGARGRSAARLDRRRVHPRLARRRCTRARSGTRLGVTSEAERRGELGVLRERLAQALEVARAQRHRPASRGARRSRTRSGRGARPSRSRAAGRSRRTAFAGALLDLELVDEGRVAPRRGRSGVGSGFRAHEDERSEQGVPGVCRVCAECETSRPQ